MKTFAKSDIESFLKFCVASHQNLANHAESVGDAEAVARHRRAEQFTVVLLNSLADNYAHTAVIELDPAFLDHLLKVAIA